MAVGHPAIASFGDLKDPKKDTLEHRKSHNPKVAKSLTSVRLAQKSLTAVVVWQGMG